MLFCFFFLHCIKWEKKVFIFEELYITKNKFHIYEKWINIDKVDIKRRVLSNKESYGNKDSYKYFTGYINKGNPSSLCIKVPQMNAYAKYLKIVNAWIFYLMIKKF